MATFADYSVLGIRSLPSHSVLSRFILKIDISPLTFFVTRPLRGAFSIYLGRDNNANIGACFKPGCTFNNKIRVHVKVALKYTNSRNENTTIKFY